jgi:hypothetical protein
VTPTSPRVTGTRPLHVAFVNENTLGHASYLHPFIRELEKRPGLGIRASRIDAVPLPPGWRSLGERTIPLLRRYGLDLHVTRWRLVTSRYVRGRLDALREADPVDAVVVNTQSVGLDLARLAAELPVFVCLDATFTELARSPWFAPNRVAAAVAPLTLAPLRIKERRLVSAATRLLGWSRRVLGSLERDYGVPREKLEHLPPSVHLPPPRAAERVAGRPRILFMGGDFQRKGGPLLLDCFLRHFADRCELHLVTQSEVPPHPGVFVHHGVKAHTPAWTELWESADVFVFPSTLETFGIVLLEALAFGVPVVASTAGAAREILADGQAGLLLPALDVESLRQAIATVLEDPSGGRCRSERGLARVRAEYEIGRNTERLAEWLWASSRAATDTR